MPALLMSLILFLLLFSVTSGYAGMRAYSGNMEIISTSGKACSDLKKQYPVTLVYDDKDGEILGYFEGLALSLGRFSGRDARRLDVRYPYHDEERAAGHYMSMDSSGDNLTVELHDRHIDDSVDECNFDHARMTMRLQSAETAAVTMNKRIETYYSAQLTKSEASALLRAGDIAGSIPLYERALSLAEQVLPADSSHLLLYLTAVANVSMRAGHYEEFNILYDRYFPAIRDKAVRAMFEGYRIRSLLYVGRKAVLKEDYDSALDSFMKAYRINPQGKDSISAVMSALLKSKRLDEAISFLEQAERVMEFERDRKEVREARALVYYKKGQKLDREGVATEAEIALRAAMKLDPSTCQFVIALARMRHKAGRYDEADDILKHALERFRDETSRQEITTAHAKMQMTEVILAQIRRKGG